MCQIWITFMIKIFYSNEGNAIYDYFWLLLVIHLLLSGKTQITYKSLRNCLYIGNSAFFFEIQAP